MLQEGFPQLQFPESVTPEDTVVETAVQATGALGIGMIGMLSVMPDLDFQRGGQAPGGSVGPGSPGGGGLPVIYSPFLTYQKINHGKGFVKSDSNLAL